MIYILETELNKNKSIFFALTKIYGINLVTSIKICNKYMGKYNTHNSLKIYSNM